MVGFVCSYVNDEEVAKDIVHDVFLVVLKNQKKLDTSYSLKSYLFTLSKNYALNYLKHLRVVAMNEREVVEALQNADEELDDYEQRMARLNEKLDELPEKQREVLMKCFVEGQTYKDVADEMGISVKFGEDSYLTRIEIPAKRVEGGNGDVIPAETGTSINV